MRADRLLSIILLLQTRGKMTAKTLAKELEVSRRTILRDITALSFSGVPVYSEGGHGGGIALVEEYRTTLTGLNKFEVQSLFVANNSDALRDVGLGDAGERLLLGLPFLDPGFVQIVFRKSHRSVQIARPLRV